MVGPALNSVSYVSRPPTNAPAARLAWDRFVEQESKPRATTRYGNMGSAGVATSGPDEPPRNRTPVSMIRTFVGDWIWVMKFDDDDYEELECQVIAWQVRQARKARASSSSQTP